MDFKKVFSRKETKQNSISNIEKKGFSIPAGFIIGGNGNKEVSGKDALRYYVEAAPVATAVDWINDEFKSLDLVLQRGNEITNDSPILTKLKRPNDDMTLRDFLETFGAYWLLCNEVYLMATGAENREPSEIFVVSPTHVTTQRGTDGLTTTMEVRLSNGGKETYKRDQKSFRFFNAQRNREIWRIKGFAPFVDDAATNASFNSSITGNKGRSKLSSIKLEIEQYIEVGKHNLSKLNNGMRPGGVIKTLVGQDLTDDQFEALRSQIISFYSGGQNSGKTLILPGGLEFIPIDKISEMDFRDLTEQVSRAVFNRYKIPLDLVTTDQASAATASTSKLTLYDNAVLPMAWRLLEELTNFLAPRYKLDDNDVILPNENTIPALQVRRNEQIKLKADLKVLVPNELRREIGYEDDVEGGDTLYIANNQVPIGTTPVVPIMNQEEVKSSCGHNTPMTRKTFIELMESQTDKLGTAIYTKEQLEQIAEDEGLV